MKTRDGVQIALLLAIGYILHYITPPLLFGMKPDVLLLMMFIALILKQDNYRLALVTGLLAGILAAITSTFPGGQLPNIIDKTLTASAVFVMLKLIPKSLPQIVKGEVVTVLGTLLSGFIFLGSAALIVGLPGASTFAESVSTFKALYLTVVLPATVINAIAIAVLQPIVQVSHRAVVSGGTTVKEEA